MRLALTQCVFVETSRTVLSTRAARLNFTLWDLSRKLNSARAGEEKPHAARAAFFFWRCRVHLVERPKGLRRRMFSGGQVIIPSFVSA